jgi:hypothetical protein
MWFMLHYEWTEADCGVMLHSYGRWSASDDDKVYARERLRAHGQTYHRHYLPALLPFARLQPAQELLQAGQWRHVLLCEVIWSWYGLEMTCNHVCLDSWLVVSPRCDDKFQQSRWVFPNKGLLSWCVWWILLILLGSGQTTDVLGLAFFSIAGIWLGRIIGRSPSHPYTIMDPPLVW